MSTKQHSPGPWVKGSTTVRAGRFEVRQVVIGRGKMPGIAEESANARLIAAAPELLAALTDLIALAEEGLRNRESDANDGVRGAQAAYETGCKEIAAAEAAIAKATGEEVAP